ncbi:MAG: hypothetical protein R3F56_04795 [Planctomycetota bacterium]
MRIPFSFLLAGLACLPGCSSMGGSGSDLAGGDTAAQVASIEAKRDAIEKRVDSLARKTLPTTGMREQIKQKWSKIDYYVDGNTVLRVKTYPHPDVSSRTEEFYFDGGQLIYACVQDHGAQMKERGGAHSEGREYYYSNGKFVTEHNHSGEAERTIRHSDEERLEQEALEYVEVFRRSQN